LTYLFFKPLKGLSLVWGQALQVGFAVVAEDTVQDLEGKIEAFAPFLRPLQEPDALNTVEKGPDAMSLAELGEDALTIMTEGGVADVVSQGDGFEEILVQTEITTDGTSDLGEELDVQNPMTDVLMLDEVKDLGFVDITGISLGMEDAVGVYGKILAVSFLNALFKAAPDGLGTPGGISGKASLLLPIEVPA